MRVLKVTEEYRCNSESEAKEAMEKFRQDAGPNGYTLGANGYTYKEKKSKGERVDEAWIVKCTKIYGTVWEEE